ncbi:glycoside hydrolase family 16 protein [Plenodomus tracheiphilus IPT5]|uniref:chitinase n=1 Tax=Plenodomus tracheiphilus IPT5 TaxID=1408161 RepID=A0A6A7BEP3_9PLEO|nr:glycoside hydrolase family 16 protein [Plenodomus tracheiphilus IPT5]
MLYKPLPWLFLLPFLASAQTTTSCNPTEKTCPADTGLNTTLYTHDFTTSGADPSTWTTTAGNVTSTPSGLLFTITKSGDAPTIRSKWSIFFGRVSFTLRTAPGTGIVSSAILQSSDLDEIDWEFLGGKTGMVETDYFGKGNATQGGREKDVAVTDAVSKSHNYTITWTKENTQWLIDGVVMRTVMYADALGGKNYPQTPMDVRIGSWAGGDSKNAKGTIEWAGGATDYSQGPFVMVLEKVEVENYNPAVQYAYGDLTGSWESIVVGKGKGKEAQSESVSKSVSSVVSKTASVTVATGTNATVTQTVMKETAGASEIKVQAASSNGAVLESGRYSVLVGLLVIFWALVV